MYFQRDGLGGLPTTVMYVRWAFGFGGVETRAQPHEAQPVRSDQWGALR